MLCCAAALPELYARGCDKCGSVFAAFAATVIGLTREERTVMAKKLAHSQFASVLLR